MISIDKYGGYSIRSTPLDVDMDARFTLRADDPKLHVNVSQSQSGAGTREQLVRAGEQFEAYFISYMLKVMRETVPEGTLANKQGAYFYSFYDEEIGRRAAESGGIGITKMVQEYAEKYVSASHAERSSFSE